MTATMGDKPSQARILAGRARVPKHVVYRSFVHETVMLNLGTGKYHGLNPTAGRMLEAIDKAASVRTAAETLAQHYRLPLAEIERDLYELCVGLEARGLLELVLEDGQPV